MLPFGVNGKDTPAFQIIQTLAKLRKESPAIWKGQYVSVYADKDILMFKRVHNGETVVVAVNRERIRPVWPRTWVTLRSQNTGSGLLQCRAEAVSRSRRRSDTAS